MTDGEVVDVGTAFNVGLGTIINGTPYGGTGTVTIGAGGVVKVTAAPSTNTVVQIGAAHNSLLNTGAVGAVTVTGAGALLDANGSSIAVGRFAEGSLTISQGGTVKSGTTDSSVTNAFTVGRQSTGTVTITDAGSSLTADGAVYVGRTGTGSLAVKNHATMTVGLDGKGVGGLTIGGSNANATAATSVYVGGSGTATVTSDGYIDSLQNVYVGSTGTDGTLTVDDGGTVEAANRILVGNSGTVAAGGTVTTSTGTTTVATATTFTATGTIDVDAGGTLKTDGGAATAAPAFVVGNGAGSSGTLNVTGIGALADAGGQRITIGAYGTRHDACQPGRQRQGRRQLHRCRGGDERRRRRLAALGTLTVTDKGSTYTASGEIEVGVAGHRNVDIENSAAVSRRSALMSACNAGGIGTVDLETMAR